MNDKQTDETIIMALIAKMPNDVGAAIDVVLAAHEKSLRKLFAMATSRADRMARDEAECYFQHFQRVSAAFRRKFSAAVEFDENERWSGMIDGWHWRVLVVGDEVVTYMRHDEHDDWRRIAIGDGRMLALEQAVLAAWGEKKVS